MKIQKKTLQALLIFFFYFPFNSFATKIHSFQLPLKKRIQTEEELKKVEGLVTIILDNKKNLVVDKTFYGADSHGFSRLPDDSLVTPLNLGYVKLGGSLHATYNWKLNAYFDNQEVISVYSPLKDRLNFIKNKYKTNSMFQVNMLGWQPALNNQNKMTYQNVANAKHAAEAIKFINGDNSIGLKHILMGNEPFDSEEYHEIHIPSADEYIEKYVQYALALRESQEIVSGNPNDIKLWGPEISTGWTGWQTNHLPDCVTDYEKLEKVKCFYGNGEFSEFIPYFLSRISSIEKDPKKNPKKYKLLDYLSFHYYSLFRTDFNDPKSILKNKNGNQDVAAMLEAVNVWDKDWYINLYDAASPKKTKPNIINTFKKWIKNYYPKAKLGLTEFGIDSMDKINYHPIVRPMYLADLIGRTAQAGLDTFINSFLQGGDVSNNWAMIEKNNKTSLYYVYSLYSNYFQGKILETEDNIGDHVNSYAVQASNSTNVFLINKDTKDHLVTINFKKLKLNYNIAEIKIPAWSMTVLIVPDNSKKQIDTHQFGAKQMNIPVNQLLNN